MSESPMSRRAQRIERLLAQGQMRELAEKYVVFCNAEGQFPNLAGFARRMRVGVELLEVLGEQYPEEYGAFLAVLEDGALNASGSPVHSPTLAVDYFRRRLGYREKERAGGERQGKENAAEFQIIFDHDMREDGQ